MDELLIAEGSVVADIGAGGGWFTMRLASRVGPNGTVYAEDVQPQMIEAITGARVGPRLKNVKTVLGTSSDPRCPHQSTPSCSTTPITRWSIRSSCSATSSRR